MLRTLCGMVSQATMDKIMQTAKDFARAQVEAGCDIIGVGDAICSQVDVESYRNFVKARHLELFEYIQSLGARVKLQKEKRQPVNFV